MTSRYSITKK